MRVPFYSIKLATLVCAMAGLAFPVYAQQAAVATPDQYAAKVATDILKAGGNAVDAAVATAFTLAVTYPEAGNIGGGGFMLIYFEGKPYFLDYREMAPLAATRDMYLDAQGNVIENMSLIGIKAVGVPGTVMGLWEAHKRFGKLAWKDLVNPAVQYAQQGFQVAQQQSLYGEEARNSFKGVTNFENFFAGLTAGAQFKQPLLADTLRRIATNGAQEFYQGKTSELLLAQMKKDNGLITRADLDGYQAKWREPLKFEWHGKQVYTAPPPSSGGVALEQLLRMQALKQDLFKNVTHNSAQHIHLMAEIEKRVFADRAEYLGDPDFIDVPVAKLIDESYLTKRANDINPSQISVSQHVKPGLDPRQTTHFSIVDFQGNAVSNTYTLNYDFGSGVVVEGAGFLLNNEMDDFSAKPGVPNVYGVVGGDANAIAAKKRMLSSMTPTLITENGQVNFVVGTPGGSRIITSVYQVINNVFTFNLPLQEAVNAQRVHHQLIPENVIFYDAFAPLTGDVKSKLESMGYTLEDQGWYMGDIQAIHINQGKISAASDARGRGVANVINH